MLPATVYPIPSGAETTAIILFLLITVALPVYVLAFRRIRTGEVWGPAEMVATTVLFVAALLLVGPVVGAVLFTIISEAIWARFIFLHMVIFGAVLIIIILFMPQGIIPWLQDRRILPRTRWL